MSSSENESVPKQQPEQQQEQQPEQQQEQQSQIQLSDIDLVPLMIDFCCNRFQYHSSTSAGGDCFLLPFLQDQELVYILLDSGYQSTTDLLAHLIHNKTHPYKIVGAILSHQDRDHFDGFVNVLKTDPTIFKDLEWVISGFDILASEKYVLSKPDLLTLQSGCTSDITNDLWEKTQCSLIIHASSLYRYDFNLDEALDHNTSAPPSISSSDSSSSHFAQKPYSHQIFTQSNNVTTKDDKINNTKTNDINDNCPIIFYVAKIASQRYHYIFGADASFQSASQFKSILPRNDEIFSIIHQVTSIFTNYKTTSEREFNDYFYSNWVAPMLYGARNANKQEIVLSSGKSIDFNDVSQFQQNTFQSLTSFTGRWAQFKNQSKDEAWYNSLVVPLQTTAGQTSFSTVRNRVKFQGGDQLYKLLVPCTNFTLKSDASYAGFKSPNDICYWCLVCNRPVHKDWWSHCEQHSDFFFTSNIKNSFDCYQCLMCYDAKAFTEHQSDCNNLIDCPLPNAKKGQAEFIRSRTTFTDYQKLISAVLNIQNSSLDSTINIPGSTINIPGSTINIPGSTINIRGSTIDIPGSTIDITDLTINIPASTINIPGLTINIPGSTIKIPGSTVNIRGSKINTDSKTSIIRSTIDIPDSTLDISGLTINTDSTTNIPGSTIGIPGSTINIPGLTIKTDSTIDITHLTIKTDSTNDITDLTIDIPASTINIPVLTINIVSTKWDCHQLFHHGSIFNINESSSSITLDQLERQLNGVDKYFVTSAGSPTHCHPQIIDILSMLNIPVDYAYHYGNIHKNDPNYPNIFGRCDFREYTAFWIDDTPPNVSIRHSLPTPILPVHQHSQLYLLISFLHQFPLFYPGTLDGNDTSDDDGGPQLLFHTSPAFPDRTLVSVFIPIKNFKPIDNFKPSTNYKYIQYPHNFLIKVPSSQLTDLLKPYQYTPLTFKSPIEASQYNSQLSLFITNFNFTTFINNIKKDKITLFPTFFKDYNDWDTYGELEYYLQQQWCQSKQVQIHLISNFNKKVTYAFPYEYSNGHFNSPGDHIRFSICKDIKSVIKRLGDYKSYFTFPAPFTPQFLQQLRAPNIHKYERTLYSNLEKCLLQQIQIDQQIPFDQQFQDQFAAFSQHFQSQLISNTAFIIDIAAAFSKSINNVKEKYKEQAHDWFNQTPKDFKQLFISCLPYQFQTVQATLHNDPIPTNDPFVNANDMFIRLQNLHRYHIPVQIWIASTPSTLSDQRSRRSSTQQYKLSSSSNVMYVLKRQISTEWIDDRQYFISAVHAQLGDHLKNVYHYAKIQYFKELECNLYQEAGKYAIGSEMFELDVGGKLFKTVPVKLENGVFVYYNKDGDKKTWSPKAKTPLPK